MKIFLSYRRDDSAGHVGRLTDRLCTWFGRDAIFRDLDSIAPGRDFIIAINEAIDACDAVVAVIGRDWLVEAGADGHRRLDDPDDFVRVEITTALERGVQVIPVLVDRAGMPSPESLPPPLAPFARRNALELSESRWDYDVQRLIKVLDPSSPETLSGSTPVVVTRPPKRWRVPAACGGLLLVVVVAAAVLFLSRGGGDSRSAGGANIRSKTTLAATTTTVAAGDGQAGGGGSAGAGGSAGSDAGAAGGGRSTGQALTQTPAAEEQPSNPEVGSGVTPTPPSPVVRTEPSPNADAVAGSWSGTVSDGGSGSFYIKLGVSTGCGLGERCGSVYVSGNNCSGDFIFYALSGGTYEFTVKNFSSTSGPNCSEGAGEFLTPQGGTLRYTTNYGPSGTLS